MIGPNCCLSFRNIKSNAWLPLSFQTEEVIDVFLYNQYETDTRYDLLANKLLPAFAGKCNKSENWKNFAHFLSVKVNNDHDHINCSLKITKCSKLWI